MKLRTAATIQAVTKIGPRFVFIGALFTLGACAQIFDIDPPKHDDTTSRSGASGSSGTGGKAGAGGESSSSSSSSMAGAGGSGGGNCMSKETLCDGKDDDCNGQIDDLPLLTCGMGVCQVTVPACVDGKLSKCIPGSPAPDELCDGNNNGIDDNCNGMIDEGCPCINGAVDFCYSGGADTRNVGTCKDGTQTCTDTNQWGPCTGNVLPVLETCNALDDDCNGIVDNGLGETTCGTGACQVTVSNCNPGGMPPACTPKDPVAELCNGIDDDCNGIIDDNNPQGGIDCMSGLSGPCSFGKTACVAGMLMCNASVMPMSEVCNSIDDNCDGTIDDGNPGSGMMCPTGQFGECATGTTTCLGGAISCIAPMPMTDVCDGLDNDCDGMADNHGVGVGNPCATGIPGECSTGFTDCKMGVLLCPASNIPQLETCDNKDNNCNGMVDEGNPGGGATCALVGLKGACAVGTMMCKAGLLNCMQTVQPTTEACDGVDNDCDGDVDEGPALSCGTCQSAIIASGSCVSLPTPTVVTLTETCKQVFPAPSNTSIPVTIANVGTQYYVSPTGNDNNDGTTPAKAWNTLCYAMAVVRPGNTIQVAQGSYLSSSLVVAKDVTVKGGYNSNFSQWNPETNPTIFYGRLTLDHAAAVWGGFRMISNPISTAQSQHSLKAGTFVRNYVETVFANTATAQSTALDTTACPGATITMLGNDVYIGAANATPLRAVGFGYQRGALVMDSNRMCAQGKVIGQTFAVNGFGPNVADTASLLMRNNLLETANSPGSVVYLLGAAGSVDFPTIMTNNTLLGWQSGVSGTPATSGKMRWRLTNNILFSVSGMMGGAGVSLGSGVGVSFDAAENNLVFGFAINALANPTPIVNQNNDTTNTATAPSVFLNAASGDFRIVVGGQADETGKNVYNSPQYGTVTTDLNQSPRPAAGTWDRGAIKN